ncbi:acetoacetate--CoA ligase, partial [Pueribacillus theae]
MSEIVKEGTLLWEPSEEFKSQSNIVRYMNWLKENKQLSFETYEELWNWSVTEVEDFWESLWEFLEIKASTPYTKVLSSHNMPGAKWFEGAKLNYTEHVFRNLRPEQPAILSKSEIRPLQEMTWQELYDQVASFAAGLKEAGIKSGDRIVAYIPNIPEAAIAFLACASIGATWSSCSPDFGSPTVVDRFKQIEPKILIAVDGYRYSGKDFNRMEAVKQIQDAIPSLEKTILLPYLTENPAINTLKNAEFWDDFTKSHQNATLTYEQVPFDHPLWVLYSSGTTGLPKAIVQGQGGIILEHLKKGIFHSDLKEDDRFFWFTTTGWMMWNVVVGALLSGSTILLYDGNPGYPTLDVIWEFAEETGMTVFGTSASYLLNCMNKGIKPKEKYDVSRIKSIMATGSPLPPEGFKWVYDNVNSEVWLASASGGTDVCTAFVLGSPILPVYTGLIQCRGLGAKVEAFDEEGHAVIDEVGELVVTEPMPSMPLFFWNDKDGSRYHESYFDMYPGVWRHGDWIKITTSGSCQIYGRSDSTINRGGIRIGTSEIYSAVEGVEGVADSLVVDVSNEKGNAVMPLFVVLDE